MISTTLDRSSFQDICNELILYGDRGHEVILPNKYKREKNICPGTGRAPFGWMFLEKKALKLHAVQRVAAFLHRERENHSISTLPLLRHFQAMIPYKNDPLYTNFQHWIVTLSKQIPLG